MDTQRSSDAIKNVEKVVLPTKVVELPTAIHEEIRVEKVKEVQPIVNVEREFTQVVQKTQPMIDKEIKSALVSERTLDTQVLPEVVVQSKEVSKPRENSTVEYLESRNVVVEKPTIYNEIDKTTIIEEIQPVVYKETVVPKVIKETKPSFQKIVEGTTYANETLPTVNLGIKGQAYVPDQSVPRGITTKEQLPTERVELPTAIHEQIRKEIVQEIQPVINIEKDFTHVVQKTQPLLDKEIKPVHIERKILETKVLPQINKETRSVAIERDFNTVSYQEERSYTIEKPAIYNEVDKLRIIEEIQPVIYKETIVPELIRAVKPIYQKVYEGTTYTSLTLPPMQLRDTHYTYPTQSVVIEQTVLKTVQQPIIIEETTVITKALPEPVIKSKPVASGKIVEEKTTTVTSVNETIPTTLKV